MSNYEVRIQITIQKTDNEITSVVEPISGKGCRIVISQEAAQSIDQCEKALLTVNYPALQQALSRHLSEISRQSAEAFGIGTLKKTASTL